jgi:hypothetical protein
VLVLVWSSIETHIAYVVQGRGSPIEDLAMQGGSFQAELAEAKKNLEATMFEAKTGKALPPSSDRGMYTFAMRKKHGKLVKQILNLLLVVWCLRTNSISSSGGSWNGCHTQGQGGAA